jgi:hypothetical protein
MRQLGQIIADEKCKNTTGERREKRNETNTKNAHRNFQVTSS